MTLPYGPLRIDLTLFPDGYQWRVGYGGNTLARASVHHEDPEDAIREARAWCAGFRAAFGGVP